MKKKLIITLFVTFQLFFFFLSSSFVCLSVCVCLYILPICLFIYFSCFYVCLNVCFFTCLSTCLVTCLSVCLHLPFSAFPPFLFSALLFHLNISRSLCLCSAVSTFLPVFFTCLPESIPKPPGVCLVKVDSFSGDCQAEEDRG